MKERDSMFSAICLLIVPAVFLGDLWVKNRIEKYIPARGEKREKKLLGGRLLIRRHHNRGAILNAGERNRPVIAAISLVLTVALIPVFFLSLERGNKLLQLGLALLLGGAFSNTYDRLKRKYVVDYLSFGVKWKWFRGIVFNISDFCIMIGALLSVLGAAKYR